MLGRIALRQAALRASKPQAAKMLRPMQLHTTGVARKEEEASEEITVPTQGLLEQAGLTDWKISAPIIGALAIPAISNHRAGRRDADSLLCCVDSEHNAVEDANLDLAKETLETHKSMLSIHEDIAAVAEAHKEAVALMCEVQAYKLRHKTRDTFVKNLEAIREIEASYNLELQKSMVASATNKVRAVVQKGDKKLKDAAFKHALDILGNADVDDSKEDDVAALFTKELRAYAADLEAKQGQVVKLTEAEQSELQADLDAYMKRFGLEDADFKAPKEVKLELIPCDDPLTRFCGCDSAGTESATLATCPAACVPRASRPRSTVRCGRLLQCCNAALDSGLMVACDVFVAAAADLSEPIDVYTDWIDECEALNA
ncbi:unnamed protein product [Phytophthora lilii]|uniref:Unnamed protein product n=1 Tax=Phytophthora lilii TaxID=2077276 RepID=A0A9W7DAJ7_9STRA|nr:unnamed protein product [Phytophthora lilii]